MVWHDPATRQYSLGMALVKMAGVALGQIDVRAAAMPHLELLSAQTNETVSAMVRREREAVIVAHLPSTQSIRHIVWIGRQLPLRTTAAGKALLATLAAGGQDWQTLVGAGGEEPQPWETSLESGLTCVIKRGYAEEIDEFEPGTAAIAAPIIDHLGTPIGALSISGPTVRFDSAAQSRAAPILIECANAVAAALGATHPAELSGSRS